MVLQIRDLHVNYGGASILRGIDLAVDQGEAVALLGRNGMGKTTLVRAIARLEPPEVTGGSIALLGRPTAKMANYDVCRAGLGLVPQGRRVFGSMTVQENLAVAAVKAGQGHDRDVWTILRVYEMFPRLAERAKQRAATLSGGEQQMLAIGRALMTNPALLVMDEPSEGLAQIVLDDIRDRLAELRGSGLSVLVVEQNIDFALTLADRVLILGENGRIVEDRPTSDMVADPSVLSRHLGLAGAGA
jgi:branched-chain amino acid transport system ATP-binding protein